MLQWALPGVRRLRCHPDRRSLGYHQHQLLSTLSHDSLGHSDADSRSLHGNHAGRRLPTNRRDWELEPALSFRVWTKHIQDGSSGCSRSLWMLQWPLPDDSRMCCDNRHVSNHGRDQYQVLPTCSVVIGLRMDLSMGVDRANRVHTIRISKQWHPHDEEAFEEIFIHT